jgi:L-Ala-D/L-Glu epimerase
MQARTLNLAIEHWPIAGHFTISRGTRTQATVVTVTVGENGQRGRGECVPYARYGESVESVTAQIESARQAIESGTGRALLQRLLPNGAARNALDCALWDLEAKLTGQPAHKHAGLPAPKPVATAFTLSLDSPSAMEEAARKAAGRPLLKIKLGGADADDRARLEAVRRAAPQAKLIVDANEGWSGDALQPFLTLCADQNVALIEQPLPAGKDEALLDMPRPVPLCADESVHTSEGLAALAGRYDIVNIKLDKAGGLTQALAMAEEAKRLGLGIMVGCMVGTSLAMAPALLLAGRARFVDLDGPLLLARDRPEGLRYEGSTVYPPGSELWG